jgi:hypothetical protein
LTTTNPIPTKRKDFDNDDPDERITTMARIATAPSRDNGLPNYFLSHAEARR